jgi:drug/metabolite transporter (DMT)-like permease
MTRVGNGTLFLIPTAIWSSTWLAITYQLGAVPPEISVAYRFALASAIIAAWCAATGTSLRFPRREHAFLAVFGTMLFGLNYIGVYVAEQYVTSGLVAVVFSTIVFMNPIGMRIAFGTPLTLRMLAAATLGVGGVALLFVPEIDAARHGGRAALGIVVAFGATVLATIGNLLAARNHKVGLPTFPATAWGMLYGALSAAITATLIGTRWSFEVTPGYIGSLAYLAVFGSVVAFGAYLTLLGRVGAGPAAFVGVATPVLALVLSTLFEGYRWSWLSALGVVLAVFGNWLALRPARNAIPRPG